MIRGTHVTRSLIKSRIDRFFLLTVGIDMITVTFVSPSLSCWFFTLLTTGRSDMERARITWLVPPIYVP